VASGDGAPSVRLRAALPEDQFLIRRWLAGSDVQISYGSEASAHAEMTLAMQTTAGLARIIEVDGVPVGYAHALEAGVLTEERSERVPAGAWRVAYFLSPAAGVSDANLADAALSLLADEVFATTLALACSAVVSIRNEPAVRAYERAGFRWSHLWHDPACGASWVMLRERPQNSPAR
jgi:aminoglycoside 6'-N-acetyltransferase